MSWKEGFGFRSEKPKSRLDASQMDYDRLVAAIAGLDWKALPKRGMLGILKANLSEEAMSFIHELEGLGFVKHMRDSGHSEEAKPTTLQLRI